jgi:ABC-type amino acid transport substrate-binding protein
LIALLAVLTMLGAACGDDEKDPTEEATGSGVAVRDVEEGSTMADIVENGKLVVGVKYDVPPFGFKNPDSGKVEGFDIDIAQAIADALGVPLETPEAISDNRIPFLQDGQVDLIASTMTITTDRDAEIDFSKPYFIAHGRVLVPGDSDITGVEDLSGKKVCTATGSTYAEAIPEQAPDAELQLVDTYSECFELVQNGGVDAVSTDDVILTGMIIQDDSLKLVGDEITEEPYGIGIPNETPDMQEFVDGVLDEIYENGYWTERYDHWVGQYTDTEGEAPPTKTLEEALADRPCEEFC